MSLQPALFVPVLPTPSRCRLCACVAGGCDYFKLPGWGPKTARTEVDSIWSDVATNLQNLIRLSAHIDKLSKGTLKKDLFKHAVLTFLYQPVWNIQKQQLAFASGQELVGYDSEGNTFIAHMPPSLCRDGHPIDPRDRVDPYFHFGCGPCIPNEVQPDDDLVWPATEDLTAPFVLEQDTTSIPDVGLDLILEYAAKRSNSNDAVKEGIQRCLWTGDTLTTIRLFRLRAAPVSGQSQYVYVKANACQSYMKKREPADYSDEVKAHPFYTVRMQLEVKVINGIEVVDNVAASQCHCDGNAGACTHKIAVLAAMMVSLHDQAAVGRAKARAAIQDKPLLLTELYDLLQTADRAGNVESRVRTSRTAAGLQDGDSSPAMKPKHEASETARSSHKVNAALADKNWFEAANAKDERDTSVWMYLMHMALQSDCIMGPRLIFPHRPGDMDDDTLQQATAAWAEVSSWIAAQPHATSLQDRLPVMRAAMARALFGSH